MPERWRALSPRRGAFPFAIEGATHGFSVSDGGEPVAVRRHYGLEAHGRALRFSRRTYLGPQDYKDDRYTPAMTPEIWPGQTFRARLTADAPVTARAFAVDYFTGETVYGPAVELGAQPTEAQVALPAGDGVFGEVGVQLTGEATAKLVDARFDGKPDFAMDFARWPMEKYNNLHREVACCTHWRGNWDVEQGALHGSDCARGELYVGDIDWADCAVSARFAPVTSGEAALLVRVGGALRGVAVGFDGRRMRIRCNHEGAFVTLAEREYAAEAAEICAVCRGRRIEVYAGGELLLSAEDGRISEAGCIGFGVYGGARGRFEFLRCTVER